MTTEEQWLIDFRSDRGNYAGRIIANSHSILSYIRQNMSKYLSPTVEETSVRWAVECLEECLLKSEIVTAVHALIDWFACKLIKNGACDKCPPKSFRLRLTKKEADLIVQRYSVNPDILAFVLSYMQGGGEIPLIGPVQDGKLLSINRDILLKWKGLYDWSP